MTAYPDFDPLDDEHADSPDQEDESAWESPFAPKVAEPERPEVTYRGATSDPVFGYIIVVALAVGLSPLIPNQIDLRFAILWIIMAGFGVLAYLLGNSARIWTETPENIGWGIAFGVIIALPILLVGSSLLQETTQRLFRGLGTGSTLAFLIVVMPLAETLFFRGVLQELRAFWIVGLLASLWSALLFFPLLDIGRFPAVGVVITTALVMMNMVYSYVRLRNGLAAAWICQIVVNAMVLFIPFVLG